MLLNSAYTKKLIGVTIWQQIEYFTPSFVLGMVSALIAIISIYFNNNKYGQLIIGGVAFFLTYFGLSFITCNNSFKEIVRVVKEKFF